MDWNYEEMYQTILYAIFVLLVINYINKDDL